MFLYKSPKLTFKLNQGCEGPGGIIVNQFSKLTVKLIIVALTAVASVVPASAAVFFFENNSPITIPKPIPDDPAFPGKADPYPSTINVRFVTGPVTHVVVRLRISQQDPGQVKILLVNPNGNRTAMLMSDAGGLADIQGVNLTFSECAPRLLPRGPIVSGTYRPSSYSNPGVSNTLPSPAPAEPYGPGLAEFVGAQGGGNVNGIWSLYVNDTVAGGTGLIDFWNITIFTSTAVPGGGNPVPCGKPDFDGDGRADIAVYREGAWFILRSSDGGVTSAGWGAAQDIPVPADYDGDAITDFAVYRDGDWFIHRSSDGGVTSVGWGIAQDIPVPADYDGDGKTDIAVYRNGDWFILRSSDGGVTSVGWGIAQDIPIN
jgi:subtilisin-like proprotein convertase family protein